MKLEINLKVSLEELRNIIISGLNTICNQCYGVSWIDDLEQSVNLLEFDKLACSSEGILFDKIKEECTRLKSISEQSGYWVENGEIKKLEELTWNQDKLV